MSLPKNHEIASIDELIQTTAKLRSPEGCPWDREQTHQSLKKYLVEEVYEVLEAIDSGSSNALLEELGDLLFQICLHAQIEADAGNFDFAAIAKRVNDKMILRHPHVFDNNAASIETADGVVDQWEKIKATEKASNPETQNTSPFASIPKALPSLARAVKVLKKADKLKLNYALPTAKLNFEEIQTEEDLNQTLLFLAERAKKLKIDPEESLRGLIAKIQLELEKQVERK